MNHATPPDPAIPYDYPETKSGMASCLPRVVNDLAARGYRIRMTVVPTRDGGVATLEDERGHYFPAPRQVPNAKRGPRLIVVTLDPTQMTALRAQVEDGAF